MHQQINLYQPIFRKQRKVLSFNTVLQINAVFLLALAAIFMFGWLNTTGLEKELATLKNQQSNMLNQLQSVTTKVAALTSKYQAENKLETLQAELNAQKFIANLLGVGMKKQTAGFSEYFDAFARQIVNGLWIKSFSIKDGGDTVEITGSALQPELVPEFINRLSAEPRLSGTQFRLLKMDRQQPQQRWVDFILSSLETKAVE